jgi:hypothetical protein
VSDFTSSPGDENGFLGNDRDMSDINSRDVPDFDDDD